MTSKSATAIFNKNNKIKKEKKKPPKKGILKLSDKTKAEAMYNYILKELIEKEMGNTTTYDTQLDGVCRKLLGISFRGVYPSDKIPVLNSIKKYAILNLDNSKEPGSHWVAIAKEPKTKKTLLYDSFGRKGIHIIPSLFHSGNGRIEDTEKDREQEIKETNCGQRCCAWLYLYDKYGEKYAKWI